MNDLGFAAVLLLVALLLCLSLAVGGRR